MLEQFINLITLIGFKQSIAFKGDYTFVEKDITKLPNGRTIFNKQDLWEIRTHPTDMYFELLLNYKSIVNLKINNDSITFIKDKFSHIIIEKRDEKLNNLIQ